MLRANIFIPRQLRQQLKQKQQQDKLFCYERLAVTRTVAYNQKKNVDTDDDDDDDYDVD